MLDRLQGMPAVVEELVGGEKYVCGMYGAELLEHIFTLLFSKEIFPQKLQAADVIVLYKEGDKNALNSILPITIVPIISNDWKNKVKCV